ncbi:MAG: efflux RND transporter periplasmic adaptor subunit [Ferruginibacter sp.]|nr:efflux RND transporter periplasmic adaptor subunit [Ferruginibacter sp.]
MKNIIVILLSLALFGCKNSQKEEDKQPNPANENHLSLTKEQLNNFQISTTELQEKNIHHTLKLNGTIDVPPQNLVSVSSAMGGRVQSTKLLPGMHFRKGEILVTLEDNQYIQLQQDYLTTKAQLQNAKEEYNRQKELNQSKASSDKVFQQAQADYKILEASLAALEQKLQLIHINPNQITVNNIKRTSSIYAPFDGYVTKVLVNIGKYVSSSDVLFELVDPRDIHLNLKVFEKDWNKIQIGMPLVSYTNNNPDKKYQGKIILIGKNISEDRAVEVHAHFENYDANLIPGMYMNATIEIPETQNLSLPDDCIVPFEGKHYVFKQKDANNFEMLAVEVGSSGDGFTEIVNTEVLKNSKIVQQGAYTLLMAMKNKGEE